MGLFVKKGEFLMKFTTNIITYLKHITFALILFNTHIHCWFTYKKPVITLFSHGIADTKKQAYLYAKSYKKNGVIHTNQRYLFHTPYVSFNYSDALKLNIKGDKSLEWLNVQRIREASFGQEDEITRLHEAYQWTIQHHGNCDIILWGLSRGASNQAIFAGLHCYDNVKAIILESP